MQCRLDFPPETPAQPVTAEFRRHVFLILKEALNNIQKHSNATRVDICLALNGRNELELLIADDGCGVELDTVPPFKHGLRNLRDRTALLRGELAIESKPGHGTRIRLRARLPSRL